MTDKDYISPTEFQQAEGTQDWRVIGDGMCAFFATSSLVQPPQLVEQISRLPGAEEHPPDLDVRKSGVTVRLLTYEDDWYGPSRRDAELARRISEAARALGLVADPSRVQSVLVIPGWTNSAEIMPFWQAILGYVPRRDSPAEDLVDPNDRGPAFWFEGMDEPREDGKGAIHVAVWLPYEQAQARVDAALAAGGRMVRDQYAPAWWTLADAAGNEADISTIESRG